MNPPPDPEMLAKQRFVAIAAVRWSGVAIAVLGMLVLAGKLDWPAVAGYFLIAVGALDALVMPLVLSKAWKSPPP